MAKALGELKPQQSGYVLQVGSSDARIKRRLVDMGITPGTRVTVTRVAPMGDPLEISLRGYELSLRREDAMRILLMDPGQEQELLAKEQEAQRNREARVRALLENGGHPAENDQAGHRRAAELTQLFLKGKPIAVSDAPSTDPVTLALVGNPNCGKTTLFNAMTGSKEYVGNWPGVTVEKKEGKVKNFHKPEEKPCGHDMTLVDLPGIYSLSPYSMEEVVARNYVIREHPDVIINIVDATNLERNLYLTVQLMELERPMIIALNMMDEVERSGDSIDIRVLSLELGVPVIPISARTGQGVEELVEQTQRLLEVVHSQYHAGFAIEPDHLFDDYTHAAHHELGRVLGKSAEACGLPRHWAEIKLLEGDALVSQQLSLTAEQKQQVDEIVARYAAGSPFGDNETRVADCRYQYITRVTSLCLKRRGSASSLTHRIDAVLTNKAFAIPIFLFIMALVFTLTFGTLGAWLSDLVGQFIDGVLSPWVQNLLTAIQSPGWIISLICDGVIAGVGGVLTFLPQIALLFFFLSLLEDCGYMARTAFIMDRAMRRFGLSGKSFIPLLMGFGCTVPATMGARTMENEKDRRMTVMLLPFMSCSAKLPVYGLIAGAFFAQYQGLVVLSLYALGILAGILSGLLFKRTVNTGADAPFVMELPPYRLPSLKNTFSHVWERVEHFLQKAGTLIFAMSVVLWFLQSFTPSFAMAESAESSILGVFGSAIAPLFAPLGFGAWQACVALLTGLVAKEAVVSSLSVFYGFSAAAAGSVVKTALAGTFTPLSALAFLVFVLLYPPCTAAIATMRRELNSTKWTLFIVGYQILAAYLMAFMVYQIGVFFF